jgi:hypothetical protein
MACTSKLVSIDLFVCIFSLPIAIVVEQYRMLDSMIQIIRTIDEKTGLPICNPDVCPTMAASAYLKIAPA